ncbi:MAG: hypothetical protein MHMPM18_003684, partial [Marteilia pararefringens]
EQKAKESAILKVKAAIKDKNPDEFYHGMIGKYKKSLKRQSRFSTLLDNADANKRYIDYQITKIKKIIDELERRKPGVAVKIKFGDNGEIIEEEEVKNNTDDQSTKDINELVMYRSDLDKLIRAQNYLKNTTASKKKIL